MTIIYTPTTGFCTSKMDPTMHVSASGLARKAGTKVRHIGCGNFGELANGGHLFVVGHGNAGAAIGTSSENYGPKDLLELLRSDGLPQFPTADVTIHLYACATGSAVKKYYFLPWRQQPYGKLFGEAMAKKGYDNYNIIAYCGFQGMDGSYSVNYHYQQASKREWLGDDNYENAPTIQFRVSPGSCTKVRGDKMQSHIEIRVHLKRQNSYVLKIRPV